MIKGLKLHCAFSYENSYINRQVLLVLQGFVGYAKLMLFGHHQSPRSGWFRQLLVFFGFSTTELLSSLFIEGLYEQQMLKLLPLGSLVQADKASQAGGEAPRGRSHGSASSVIKGWGGLAF